MNDEATCPHGFTPDEDCDPCDVTAQEAMARILQDAQREERLREPPTLASLLEAFETVRARYRWDDTVGDVSALTVDDWAAHYEIIKGPICDQRWFGTQHLPIAEAAKVYVIARDDGLSAAMLWKLKYGGM